MCFSATILRPFRSKRAMISPVRPRAKASGLTRIRVRSVAMWPRSQAGGAAAATDGAGLLGRELHRRRLLLGDAAAARGGLRRSRRGAADDLRLAVRADLPVRLQGLGAVAA